MKVTFATLFLLKVALSYGAQKNMDLSLVCCCMHVIVYLLSTSKQYLGKLMHFDFFDSMLVRETCRRVGTMY